MGNKFNLLLLLLMYLAIEIFIIFQTANLIAKEQWIFAIITTYGVHYYAEKTIETFKRIIQGGEENE